MLPVGDEGLLLEVADLDAVLALDGALRAAGATGGEPWQDVTDVVPAARTVLLLTHDGSDLVALRAAVLDAGRLRATCAQFCGRTSTGSRTPARTRSRSRCATTAPTSTTSPASPA